MFLLRDYDIIREQVEVNIIVTEETKKTLDLVVVTKGEYVSMSMNLNKWKQYLRGELNELLGYEDDVGNATISNSVFLQVFKYGNNKKKLWDQLNDTGKPNKPTLDELIANKNNSLACEDLQGCKKYLAGDWGMVQFIVPGRNCSIVEFEALSRIWFLTAASP